MERNNISTGGRIRALAETPEITFGVIVMIMASAIVFAVPAHAAPTANNGIIFQLQLAGDVDETFNIHDVGLVSGDPSPIYLSDSILIPTGTVLPTGL